MAKKATGDLNKIAEAWAFICSMQEQMPKDNLYLENKLADIEKDMRGELRQIVSKGGLLAKNPRNEDVT